MKPLILICGFAAFLVILGAAAIVVGMHDSAFASASVGLKVLSALLLVVGVVLLVAAYQLAGLTRRSTLTGDWRPQCKPIVLVAFLLTIVLGLYVFFAAIGTSGAQRIVVVVGALAVIVVGLLGLRFFGRDARITHLRVEGAIALGVIGIVVGVGQFWFQNQYVPSHAGRAVALKVALSRAGEKEDYERHPSQGRLRRHRGRSVAVIGSAYTLTGSHVVRCHRPATVKRVRDVFDGFAVDPQSSRYMNDAWEERPSTVHATGKFVGDGSDSTRMFRLAASSSSMCPATATSSCASARNSSRSPPRSDSHSARCRNTRASEATTSCTDSGRLSTTAGSTT